MRELVPFHITAAGGKIAGGDPFGDFRQVPGSPRKIGRDGGDENACQNRSNQGREEQVSFQTADGLLHVRKWISQAHRPVLSSSRNRHVQVFIAGGGAFSNRNPIVFRQGSHKLWPGCVVFHG